MACCPFHHEKTPSFSVTPSKGIYHCFGCGKSGDSIQFVMDHETFTFSEAIVFLAAKYNIAVVELGNKEENIQQDTERESLLIALQYANDHYVHNLWESDEGKSIGLSYFRERGFIDPIIKKFNLGYSLDAWEGLLNKALGDQFKPEILQKAGLALARENANDSTKTKLYDRFRGRVMFPIHSVAGKVIGFGARILTKDKNQPKYLNSPESDVYHKSKVLYGIFQAKGAIRKLDECFLVEGYTDVVSLHQGGIEHVVASSGTALTEDQIKLVKRYTPNITLLYDGDSAGLKAAMRGVDLIIQQEMNVSIVVLPDQEDPDSFMRKLGGDGMMDYVKQHKKDFITFKAGLLSEEAGRDPYKKAAVIKDIVESITQIKDGIKRAVFFRECSRLLDVDEQVLISEYNKSVYTGRKNGQGQQTSASQEALQEAIVEQQEENQHQTFDYTTELVKKAEESTITLLLNYFDELIGENLSLGSYVLHELEEISFQVPVYNSMVQEMMQRLSKGEAVGSLHFIKHPDANIRKEAIRLLSSVHAVSANWEKFHIIVPTDKELLSTMTPRSVLILKRVAIRLMMDELMAKIKEEKEEKALTDLLLQIKELKKISDQINGLLGIVVG
ncbi:MAG: dnaG [Chitinophagaceae bacterium]|nr:dnaG [Chitinophagaceae bacterium]